MAVGDGVGVQVGVDERGDATAPVITLTGELDLAGVEAVRAGIAPYLAASPERLTFDLEQLTFMDSSGIALMIEISNEVADLSLIHVTPVVHRVLEITGLLEQLGVSE